MSVTNVTLRGIVCDKTREAVDEVLLLGYTTNIATGRETALGPDHDGRIWGPRSMNDGDARTIDWGRILRGERLRIELWEYDKPRRRWLDKSEHIGNLVIEPTNERGVEQSHRIEGRGARYRLIYVLNPRLPQFVLELGTLHCNDAQEPTDEPYIVVNGDTVWGPASMRTGSEERVGYRHVGANAIVELWERDLARSERIGNPFQLDERRARIYAREPLREHQCIFIGDRGFPGTASYTLTFRVYPAG